MKCRDCPKHWRISRHYLQCSYDNRTIPVEDIDLEPPDCGLNMKMAPKKPEKPILPRKAWRVENRSRG